VQSCDSNILLYYCDDSCSEHANAQAYLESVWNSNDFVISDLALTELYVLLRNAKVLRKPLSAREAATLCLQFRSNHHWQVVECAFGIMPGIWKEHSAQLSSAWQIYDLRLALTLRRAGVEIFATRNTKDFKLAGFRKLINPIDDV